MNTTRALLTAALVGVSFLTTHLPAEPGLIGHRYAGLDFNYERYNSSGFDFTLGPSAVLNVPLRKNLDASFDYDLAHTNDSDHSLNHNALAGSLLAHQRTEYGIAYFSGTVGQNWNRIKHFGILSRDDDAFWGFATGYEVAMGRATAYNAGLVYRKPFRGNQTIFKYRIEASHWFKSDFAGIASISYNQIKHAPDTLLYTIGVRWSL